MKRCRLCELPIVEGEEAVDDLLGYWAHHPKLHAVCVSGDYQPVTKQALGSDDQASAWLADEAPEVGVPSRAMPRNRQLKVSRDRL